MKSKVKVRCRVGGVHSVHHPETRKHLATFPDKDSWIELRAEDAKLLPKELYEIKKD